MFGLMIGPRSRSRLAMMKRMNDRQVAVGARADHPLSDGKVPASRYSKGHGQVRMSLEYLASESDLGRVHTILLAYTPTIAVNIPCSLPRKDAPSSPSSCCLLTLCGDDDDDDDDDDFGVVSSP